jgi:tetratricopeptide (TPR) repeat protein
MADGMLGGVLGDKDENTDVETPDALAGAEAFASAVAAKLAGNDPEVARHTSAFLQEQTQLLKVQKEHLNDEHALRITHLRNQLSEETVRRFGLRMRVGFQLFIVLFATVIGIGIAVMIYDAVTSRRVVVDAFEAPPALAARGVSGTVVASGLLDELTRMRIATRTSMAAKRDLSSAWSNEVKVSLPDSGISLSELSRLIKDRFGHELHIGGDLIETSTGSLSLTVRGNGVPPKTFTGSADQLAKVTVEAAQYVYAESQPVLWAIYLENEYRYAEEVAFIKSVYAAVDPTDRPYMLNSWANAQSALNEPSVADLKLYQEAIRLKADYWPAYSNVMFEMMQFGDEEGAWHVGRQLEQAAGGRPGAAPETFYGSMDTLTWNLQSALSAQVADTDANGGFGTTASSGIPLAAQLQVSLHDTAAAELTLETVKLDDRDPSIEANVHYARGRLAMEVGNISRAVTEMEQVATSLGNPQIANNLAPFVRCWIAVAEESAGRSDEAEAALKAAGTFVDCYRFRADILNARRDWPGAQKAYAAAVALAPDLPAAYYSWGVALTQHGDLVGAITKLSAANQRGPHWADPLKAWGDVLMKQNQSKDALAKYDEALRYAPNWKQLKEAREAAVKAKA